MDVSNVENVKSYFPKADIKEVFILDYLKHISYHDTSLKERKKIADANGITHYCGTFEQNLKMLNLAKQGKLIKP